MDTPVKQAQNSVQVTISEQMNVKKQLAKIYRLFSSKKYMKYKHQFPRMKETQIVNKIIKQWQLMSKEQKLGLGAVYSKNQMLDSESDQEGSNFSDDKVMKKTIVQKNDYLMSSAKKIQPVSSRGLQGRNKKIQVSEMKIQQLSTAINKIQLQNIPKGVNNCDQQLSKVEHNKQQQQKQQGEQSWSELGWPIKQKVQVEEKKEIQIQGERYKAEEYSQYSQQQRQQQQELLLSPHEDNSESELPTQRKKCNKKKLNTNKKLVKQEQTGKRKVIKKEKLVKKQINYSQLNNGQYLLFYKYYFQKLRQQHPKWSEIQITFIIKLLWKKHTQKQKLNQKEAIEQEKRMKKQINNPSKPKKPISGKEYFTNEKRNQQLTKQEINILWKELPRQSKSYWNKMATQVNMKNTTKSSNIKTDSNIKSETPSTKTEHQQKKPKMTIVTFKDLLLKGRIIPPIINEHIIQQKKQSTHPITQSRHNDQNIENNQPQHIQDIKYVSLQANPFAFMMKKIDNKILLE